MEIEHVNIDRYSACNWPPTTHFLPFPGNFPPFPEPPGCIPGFQGKQPRKVYDRKESSVRTSPVTSLLPLPYLDPELKQPDFCVRPALATSRLHAEAAAQVLQPGLLFVLDRMGRGVEGRRPERIGSIRACTPFAPIGGVPRKERRSFCVRQQSATKAKKSVIPAPTVISISRHCSHKRAVPARVALPSPIHK